MIAIYFCKYLDNLILCCNFAANKQIISMNIFKKIFGWLQFIVDLIKYLTNYKSK